MARSSSSDAGSSFTPMFGLNSPANMFPLTKAPRLPNIGFTSTPGVSGIIDLFNCLSSSEGLGIFTVSGILTFRGRHDAEGRALRVGDAGHPADGGDVHRLFDDLAAECHDLRCAGVDVL